MESINVKDIIEKLVQSAEVNDGILSNEDYKALIKRRLSVKNKIKVIEELENSMIDFSEVEELQISYESKDYLDYENNLHIYSNSIATIKLLTREQEFELSKRIKRGDKGALEELISANTRLVVSIASRYSNRGVNIMDLIQEGNMGLITVAKKFDYTKNCRFSTIATIWIKQSILMCINKTGRTISLPLKITETATKIQKLKDDYIMKHGVNPSDDYISEALKLPVYKISEILNAVLPLASLDYTFTKEDQEISNKIESVIPIPKELETENIIMEKCLRQDINSLLNTLTDKEKFILVRRFGLQNTRKMTLDAIGDELGLTKERIRQIEAIAIRKLRHPSRSTLVKDYIE